MFFLLIDLFNSILVFIIVSFGLSFRDIIICFRIGVNSYNVVFKVFGRSSLER